MWLKILLLVSMYLGSTQAYSGGPPDSVCDSMTPGHGPQAQSSQVPYEITTNSATYSPGQTITVTLSGKTNEQFKGFFIQARPDASTYTTYGSIGLPANSINPCSSKGANQNVAISHNDGTIKSSVSFQWTAPNSDVGNIVFVFTVVEDKVTYWVRQTSTPLTYLASVGPTNPPVTTTAAPTNPPTTGTFDRDPACGVTKSCFPDPSGCSTDCDYLVTWHKVGTDDVEFTLKRKTSTTSDYYIAIGFSKDPQMGDDSVHQCVSQGGTVEIQTSSNPAGGYKYNELMDPVTFGVTLLSSSYTNGVLSCTFQRKISYALASAALGRRKRAAPNDNTFFDLNTEFFLLVAHGAASSGSIMKHTTAPEISAKIDFLAQPTSTPDTTTQSQGSPATFDRDPACGVTKSCFPDPSSCSTDCDYLVTWHKVGTDDVEFTLKRKTSTSSYYIAIGFSKDLQMGDDSAHQCVSNGGTVEVQSSFNPAGVSKYNDRLDPLDFGVSLISGSFANGVLSCTFRRKITYALASAAASGRRKREAASNTSFFDLTSEYFLLVAHGPAPSGFVSKHTEIPHVSGRLDFLTVTPDPSGTTTPAQGSTATLKKDSDCGSTLGCFHDCTGDSCGFLLTWKEDGNDIALTLTCKQSGNRYCAIGLSSDNKMGDDSVFECIADNGNVDVKVSYNNGRRNELLTDDKFGISGITTSQVDGLLKCQFRRKKNFNLASGGTGRRKRAAPGADTYFDMDSDWTLLFAYGDAQSGLKQKHSVLPVASSQVADFQSFDDIGASNNKNTLVKVHAVLMTVAWMLLASFGIFSARYCKQIWPDGMEWCELKRWFVIHRMCMVTVFLCTAAAFVIIFVHVGGFAEISGTTFQKSHPIIGIVVMALTIINPMMAAFRPHPGTPKRPIFNVAHLMVGSGAHVCSVVNIFSGTLLTASAVSDVIRIPLYIFCGWLVLCEISLNIYNCSQTNSKKGEAYEMNNFAESSKQQTPKVQMCKLWTMVLHGTILIGLTAAVVALIIIGEHGGHDHDD